MLYAVVIILVITIILHSNFIHFTYVGRITDEDGNQLYEDPECKIPTKGDIEVDWSPWVMLCLLVSTVLTVTCL